MKLRLILGDQLSPNISSLHGLDPSHDMILMAEVMGEATYVKHHKKKIAFLFAAMRNFAQELQSTGHRVRYIKINDPKNSGSLMGEITRAVAEFSPTEIIVTEPGEYRLYQDFKNWRKTSSVQLTLLRDTRFLSSIKDFKSWAEGRKSLRMEYFYRDMRRRYKILMDGDQPVGGKWNYDAENRKPPKEGLKVPPTFKTEPDETTTAVLGTVAKHFPDHFGDLEPFHFATTRAGAQAALDDFLSHRLPHFGTYQDAMIEGEPWMYHSHISLYLNAGLLDPLDIIQKAEQVYHNGQAPLNAVEGFIRQILGWREYVRGIYWTQMPNYAQANHLNATRPLPPVYWGAATDMNCLSQCVSETWQNAYAHHIQRLMVLGNFALLAGLNPDEVSAWYLIVYADAYEWVEMPNVTGMVLFADGGLLGSKPYAASGAYIHRMSNYCENCKYDVKAKTGRAACPFNYLYWDFLNRNKDKLGANPRLGMPYRNLARMSSDKLDAIETSAHAFLGALDRGEKV